MNPTLTALLSLIQLFFGSNPTVEEVVPIIEQLGPAIAAAKSGQPFSVTFPLSVDAVKGSATFAWTTAAPATSA